MRNHRKSKTHLQVSYFPACFILVNYLFICCFNSWYKDDILIASANLVKNDDYDKRLRLQDVPFGGKLRLEPVLKTDEGWFKCVAENADGVRETSAFVSVNEDELFRERCKFH